MISIHFTNRSPEDETVDVACVADIEAELNKRPSYTFAAVRNSSVKNSRAVVYRRKSTEHAWIKQTQPKHDWTIQ